MSGPLASIADVEAVSGNPVAGDERTRVETLIEMASAVVDQATINLPDTTPAVVRAVTASMVVRVMANPTQASSESLGQWRVGYFYARGFGLTEDEEELLGQWLKPSTRAYSVITPAPFAVDEWAEGFIDFSRDDAAVIPTEGGVIVVPSER
jgi:hypothetical protein